MLAPVQHSFYNARVVAALDEDIVILAVLAEAATVFLADSVVLRPHIALPLK